ncbi:MAG: CPBP family intramembrane metalloprotease [Lachnospiraceae bacterium]|nr:CPBP family intramembrane metalloprotease [Lachnospiraceae bacterium]
MTWIIYVLSPVLIHLVFSEGVAILAGDILDSAACTALSAFLMLPAAIWMYRRDAIWRTEGSLQQKTGGETQRMVRETMDRKTMIRNAKHPSVRVGKMHGPAWYAVCFMGGGILNVAWSGFLYWLGISSVFSNQTQEALLGSQMVMQVLGPGLLVPVAEELIFRGLVYERMRTRLCKRQAVFFSALLFALYHGNPIQMIYAFPMAMLLALLYEQSGCLVAPVLFHMGANLTAIFFS